MTAPWLSIVGIGEDGMAGLSAAARALVDGAEVLVGAERHHAMVDGDAWERLIWPSPIADLIPEIERRRGRAVCVLATGDPMFYGIGATLARRIPIDEMTVVPAPSAFALACARLGWPRHEVETLSLHGRPTALVHGHIQPGARLLMLANGPGTADEVARILCHRGYGGSRLTVLEHMGGEDERRVAGTARDWPAAEIAAFHTLAVECVAETGAPLLPRTPGLPDEAFVHDGLLTKREIRAVTLAALAPVAGQLLWDVGAGCGSVAIEWMRGDRRCKAVAVERHPDRARLIADNAAALGTPGLEIVTGAAPDALARLAPPDAVFVGGGLTAEGLVESCWRALAAGGRLVANAVTVEGERALIHWHAETGGTLGRIAVSRAEPMGAFSGWRASAPVTQLAAVKR